MSPRGVESLIGRTIRGVVALASRSLAVSFEGTPKLFLWIHLEPKDAWYAVASDLPAAPDPRGSRFQPIESALRRAVVTEAQMLGPGGIRVTARTRGDEKRAFVLTLEPEGSHANLTLVGVPDDVVLWALHREKPRDEPERDADATPRTGRAPRVQDATEPSAREPLRERIARSFRVEFAAEVQRTLDAAERTLNRRIEGAEEDRRRAEAMREERRRGEILLANFSRIKRGASRVGLPDPYADSPRAMVEIKLDPALSPQENAAVLFRKAKKGERGEKLAGERLAETRLRLRELHELQRHASVDDPKNALDRIQRFLAHAKIDNSARGDVRKAYLGRQASVVPRAGRPGHRPPGARESVRPRTYVTHEGWEVWVGRSNIENDLITHRLSNPHDFWFHVVGAPGSHVILRRPTRNSKPKQETLVEAAQIAAYFSKARKLTRVPVMYTERKFVSRPKRAKPGQAICTRERELLVRPKKPEQRAGTD